MMVYRWSIALVYFSIIIYRLRQFLKQIPCEKDFSVILLVQNGIEAMLNYCKSSILKKTNKKQGFPSPKGESQSLNL